MAVPSALPSSTPPSPPGRRGPGCGWRTSMCPRSTAAAGSARRGCARLEWTALHWNEPALRFYRKLGARRLDDWVLHRLDGSALEAVAGEAAGREAAGGDPRGPRHPAPAG